MSTTGGGPDHHGYLLVRLKDHRGPEHDWTDISKTGKLLTELSKTDDFGKITLPFEVDFFTERKAKCIRVLIDNLTLEEGSKPGTRALPLPSRMMPTALVSAFAKDLNPSVEVTFTTKTGQNEPVVQYDKVKDFAKRG